MYCIDVGRCGSELGENKRVVLETQFENEGVDLSEVGESVAGVKEG